MGVETTKMVDFIECVCSRPTMFVRSGSFEEVATLLEGYTMGLIQFASADVRADCLYAFGFWLSDNCKGLREIPHNLCWPEKLRHLHPEDREALEALARLYRQFLEDSRRTRRVEAEAEQLAAF